MKRVLLCGLFLICGATKAHPLFEYNWRDKTAVVVLQQSAGHSDTITKTRVYYLTREDCVEGLLGDYVTPLNAEPFWLIPARTFALNGQTVFSIGEKQLHAKITAIHGILLRFEGNKRTVSQFFGTCVDQLINCCIPVDCSAATQTCVSGYPMEVQSFEL